MTPGTAPPRFRFNVDFMKYPYKKPVMQHGKQIHFTLISRNGVYISKNCGSFEMQFIPCDTNVLG